MSQPKIRAGMVVRNREGEPLGRVLSVDDSGFVLEHRVVVTREHRVRFEEMEAVDGHGIVLGPEHAPARRHLEGTDLMEVFWSARRARDEQKSLEQREAPETLASHQMVSATEHAEAYPVQVERGTVRAPRYVPMTEEQSGPASPPGEPPRASRPASTPPADTPPERRTHMPWIHAATHPLQTATSLLGRLRGDKSSARH